MHAHRTASLICRWLTLFVASAALFAPAVAEAGRRRPVRVALKTHDGRYLAPTKDGGVTLTDRVHKGTMWSFTPRGLRTASLETWGDRRPMTVSPDGRVIAPRARRKATRWRISTHRDDVISLIDPDGRYLSYRADGAVVVEAGDGGPWTRLEVLVDGMTAEQRRQRRMSASSSAKARPSPIRAWWNRYRERRSSRDSAQTKPSGGKRCRDGGIPKFPTPVPTPSARMALPKRLLTRTAARQAPRLRDVSGELGEILRRAGYAERAYFRLTADKETVGFALVTRMERIKSDGRPYPPEQRFAAADAPDQFELVSFLKSLFVAPVGYYRVLVFLVSRTPIKIDGDPLTEDKAQQMLQQGASRLTGCLADAPFTDEYGIEALIYEFRHAPEEQAGKQAVSQLKPSQLGAGLHLQRAGILRSR